MQLSEVEVRILGALVEKERTTPDAYPLSLQALHTACNQRTSREPVMDLHLQDVQSALQRLRDRGMTASVQEVGDRVPKHRHLLARALDLDDRQLAVLAVLMLRGAQTPGELRSRTERYLSRPFDDLAAVEAVLDALAGRTSPMVKNLGRAPGQSQDRWNHLLAGDEERLQPRVRQGQRPGQEGEAPRAAPTPAEAAPVRPPSDLEARLLELERRVRVLEQAMAAGNGAVERAGVVDLVGSVDPD